MRFYVKSKVIQLSLLVFLLQFLVVISPLTPQTSSASPAVFPDSVWEGAGAPNDNIWTAWNLGSNSIKNNPNAPLNVSTWSPDYYNFTVYPGFYFSVFLELNKTNAYNTSNLPITYTDPVFYADIDIELIAANGSILDISNGNDNEEVLGPIFTTSNEIFTINVTAVNPLFGYESEQYSTTYNMSVVLEDKWEILTGAGG